MPKIPAPKFTSVNNSARHPSGLQQWQIDGCNSPHCTHPNDYYSYTDPDHEIAHKPCVDDCCFPPNAARRRWNQSQRGPRRYGGGGDNYQDQRVSWGLNGGLSGNANTQWNQSVPSVLPSEWFAPQNQFSQQRNYGQTTYDQSKSYGNVYPDARKSEPFDVFQQLRSFGVKENLISKIRQLNTPEEIEEWRAERRQKFPRKTPSPIESNEKTEELKSETAQQELRNQSNDSQPASPTEKSPEKRNQRPQPPKPYQRKPKQSLYQKLMDQEINRNALELVKCLEIIQDLCKGGKL